MELPNVWIKYFCRIKMRDRILGGNPKHPDKLQQIVDAGKRPETKMEEMTEELDPVDEEERAKEEEEKRWSGFRKDDKGLFIRSSMIKQMIKVSAQRLGLYKRKRGSKDSLHGAMFIKPEKIYFGKDKADGQYDHQGRVQTPRGGQSIVSRFDYMKDFEFECEIWMVANCPLNEEDLLKCFALGQEGGLGSMRPADFGKFDLLEFKRIEA